VLDFEKEGSPDFQEGLMSRDASSASWLPFSPLALASVLVSCISAAVAIYAWTNLVRAQREHVSANLRGVARHCSDALERRAWSQAMALGDLAHAWGTFEGKPEAEWRHEASALATQQPSLRELRWTDGPERREFLAEEVSVRPEFEAQLGAAEERVRRGSARELVSPVGLSDGSWAFVVLAGPSTHGSAAQPVLRAVFDYPTFAARALEDRATGYAYTVWSAGKAVAIGPEPPADDFRWWRSSEQAIHPFGATWRVELRPTTALARQELSILPHVLLATSLLAAAMIGALVWTARVAARRARAMFATNVALAEITARAQPDQAARAESAAGVESTARERTEDLREAVLDLEAFNVSVSHDLRSPIGAIVNLTSVLRETNSQLDADALELLRRIDRSAYRALARMDGLLDFSRLGRKPLCREEVDLRALAWRIARELRQTPADARVEFVLGDVPSANGDPAMLEALLRNLLANGAKFARGREKPKVEFGALASAPGEPTAYFVRDNGVGFDAKYAEKVFGLFERQHHTSEFEGTGVGLAIVSRIARRHGGRVWAESAVGEGAAFYFTLGPER